MSSADYGIASRLLHRVALASPAILRATMQMEQGRWPDAGRDGDTLSPVFIAGLARSGSTLLLNRLVATGAFSTSTYRHMPFVLAPNIWGKATKAHRQSARAVERAHGDGMTHSADAEEAFEEVFWRAVSPASDAAMLGWAARVPAADLTAFRGFMASVVRAGDAPRYLSKNNNNVQRVAALLRSARDARVVIPFRNPAGFAGSTLAQHRAFLARHGTDRFDAQYMAWLGHHEFGPNFKPFAAPGVTPPTDVANGVTADYLIAYWCAVYDALLAIDDERLIFFDYDAFCAAPVARMAALGSALALDVPPAPPDGVHPPRDHGQGDGVPGAARRLHKRLQARAIA
ncbi:MAG: sulfotransferase [Rhodobacteraceae bacterium]|nr:sulfotransferase [Paracoccaceae bacterium]